MSTDWQSDIKELMKAFDQEIKDKPEIPDEKTIELRARLCEEEFNEMMEALGFDEWYHNLPLDGKDKRCSWDRSDRKPDLVKLSDGMIDLFVVTIGMANAFGIDLRPIWDVIHANNMTKASGPIREDGKKLKPEGWTPPDVEGELKKQGWTE